LLEVRRDVGAIALLRLQAPRPLAGGVERRRAVAAGLVRADELRRVDVLPRVDVVRDAGDGGRRPRERDVRAGVEVRAARARGLRRVRVAWTLRECRGNENEQRDCQKTQTTDHALSSARLSATLTLEGNVSL